MPRDFIIRFRVNQEELHWYNVAAKDMGFTLSQWMRYALDEFLRARQP